MDYLAEKRLLQLRMPPLKDNANDTLGRDYYALRSEIRRRQEELTTVLESKGRATKDERTVLVTHSLDAFKKVDDFLVKYIAVK